MRSPCSGIHAKQRKAPLSILVFLMNIEQALASIQLLGNYETFNYSSFV